MAQIGHLLFLACLILLCVNLSVAVRNKSQCVFSFETKTEKLTVSVKHYVLKTNGTLEERPVNESYEIITIVNKTNDQNPENCRPRCDPRCSQNADCVWSSEGNPKCVCHMGYNANLTDQRTRCVPHCTSGCGSNTQCLRPGACDCKKGHHRLQKEDHDCKPICPNGCGYNQECAKPNECKCKYGYKKDNRSICMPDCSKAPCADNQECIGPETCGCKTGYTNNTKTNVCEPHCPSDCPANMKCIGNDLCICNEGYKRDSTGACKPVCEHGCKGQHEECVTPGKCGCQTGYKNNTKTTVCEPQCSPGCPTNGYCAIINGCKCKEGYEIHGELCKPICTRCGNNTHCLQPGECECQSGYHRDSLNGDDCKPTCEYKCGNNSTCVSHNFCSCNDGYVKSNSTNDECIPKCENCLDHSYCQSPGNCACNPGYKGDHPHCDPICDKVKCGDNSYCLEPNKCECTDGYQATNPDKTSCSNVLISYMVWFVCVVSLIALAGIISCIAFVVRRRYKEPDYKSHTDTVDLHQVDQDISTSNLEGIENHTYI